MPAVLVVAGGEGMGPVEKTCSAIAKACGTSVQLVVVCGRNAKLSNRLIQRAWPPGMHVLVQVRGQRPRKDQLCRAAGTGSAKQPCRAGV